MANNNGFTVRVIDNSGAILNRFNAEHRARLMAAGAEWHKGVVKILRGSRSGRIYRVPGTQRMYQASAPGEAPASRLGDLRTSYKFIIHRSEALIGSPLHYARSLEFGTRKMAKRPHLKKAYMMNRQAIIGHLTGTWF